MNTRYCGRGTRYGNDYKIIKVDGKVPVYYVENEITHYVSLPFYELEKAHKHAVTMHEIQMHGLLHDNPAYYDDLLNYEYLSCFCPLDMPCHVDAIIEHLKRRAAVLGTS